MTKEQIRMIRHIRRLTLKEFAQAIGRSVPLVDKMERGERRVTEETKERIVKAFEITEKKLAEMSALLLTDSH